MNAEISIAMHDAQSGHQALSQGWKWAKAHLMAGRAVAARFALLEDEKSDKQRRFYHGVVLKQISQQASANGQKFPLAVWKEHFRKTYLGSRRKTFTDPMTGKKSRRQVRISTEDLSVKRYSELIEKVMAFAVTDLNVEFTERNWQEWAGVDPETGEIIQ